MPIQPLEEKSYLFDPNIHKYLKRNFFTVFNGNIDPGWQNLSKFMTVILVYKEEIIKKEKRLSSFFDFVEYIVFKNINHDNTMSWLLNDTKSVNNWYNNTWIILKK